MNVTGNEVAALQASPVHGYGLMHQIVENERAGWVRNWREVAATHDVAEPEQSEIDSSDDGGVSTNDVDLDIEHTERATPSTDGAPPSPGSPVEVSDE